MCLAKKEEYTHKHTHTRSESLLTKHYLDMLKENGERRNALLKCQAAINHILLYSIDQSFTRLHLEMSSFVFICREGK